MFASDFVTLCFHDKLMGPLPPFANPTIFILNLYSSYLNFFS